MAHGTNISLRLCGLQCNLRAYLYAHHVTFTGFKNTNDEPNVVIGRDDWAVATAR